MKDIIISVGLKDSPRRLSIVMTGDEFESAFNEVLGEVVKKAVRALTEKDAENSVVE